ncbi:MAG: hypothetical protein ABSG23_10055 [Terriglobales bacterium]|jgi:hypothetical protein
MRGDTKDDLGNPKQMDGVPQAIREAIAEAAALDRGEPGVPARPP